MSEIWTICGAGRAVGKTTLARSIAKTLTSSVYCKCGHNPPKDSKPDNYFLGIDDLTNFIDKATLTYANIVVESNAFVYSGRADIIIYIDGVTGTTNFRNDADQLKSAADIVITPDSSVNDWEKNIANKISDAKIVQQLCQCFSLQHQWLFPPKPKVCSKVWFESGGDHVFGCGLARLLENVDKLGTLQAAADSSKMSYRYAWNLIKSAERHLGSSLIERHSGGTGGGGSVLSPKGRAMLKSFRQINKEVADFADQRYKQLCTGDTSNE
jgi:molybdate transport system regulatory protein